MFVTASSAISVLGTIWGPQNLGCPSPLCKLGYLHMTCWEHVSPGLQASQHHKDWMWSCGNLGKSKKLLSTHYIQINSKPDRRSGTWGFWQCSLRLRLLCSLDSEQIAQPMPRVRTPNKSTARHALAQTRHEGAIHGSVFNVLAKLFNYKNVFG